MNHKAFIIISVLLLGSKTGLAEELIKLLPDSKRYNQPQKIYIDSVQEVRSATSRTTDVKIIREDHSKEIERLKRENLKLRGTGKSNPIVINLPTKIRPLDEFKGVILNSTLVTSYDSEVVVVSSEKKGPLKGAKLDCTARLQGSRIKAYCTRAIYPNREIETKILLRDFTDGADVILPKKIWTSEESDFVKLGFSTFAAALFDSAKERSVTAIGDTENASSKNRTLDGLFGVADMGRRNTEKGLNEIKMAAVIESGTPVLIQFLEGVNK